MESIIGVHSPFEVKCCHHRIRSEQSVQARERVSSYGHIRVEC